MANGPDPDVGLMLRFQKGDESAFEEIVSRNRRRVVNLVYRFIGFREDAFDLAQDVFVGVYRSRDSYRPAAKFSTWLFRNTLNVCLNYNRSMKLRRAESISRSDSTETDQPVEIEDGRQESPLSAAERNELALKVREAVGSLPPNQRTVVLLCRYEKLSYREIADVMELSVQAVKSLLSRAKENLRLRLEAYVKQGR